MSAGFRIGRISGIEIHIDWSLSVIFFIITFTLAAGLFPNWHPEWRAATSWFTALAAAVLFFCSVLVHEMSHALVGRMHGIEVRRITLFVFGGAAQMEDEPPHWYGELQTAIIGPVVSLVIGGLCLLITASIASPLAIDPANLQENIAALGPLPTLLLWLGQINIVLAIFNMVPAFPLDGGRVLRAIIWRITRDLRRATRWAAGFGQGFAWLLVAFGLAMILGVRVPLFGSGLIGGLWLCLIGWFLNNAAQMSYWQLLMRESLRNVPVTRLMQTGFASVPPDLMVDRLVDDYLLHSSQADYPVMVDGRLLGSVSLRDVRKVGRGRWAATPVRQVMRPASREAWVSPLDDARKAMSLFSPGKVDQVQVVENGQVCGLVRREDIVKWLSLYENVDMHLAAVIGKGR